ncbi:MAG: ABC transporter permease [Microscillaceae bacterium]|jgi:putative ABC transport system permease protein|nr:ABC transporter permease [Microscillaceae bacterium]
MLKNYFKITLRNLWKNRVFSFINIAGLAFSMSVCLLLIMMMNDMYGYDQFHPQGKQVYRVITQVKESTNQQKFWVASTTLALGNTLQNSFGKDISIVKLSRSVAGELIVGNQNFLIKQGFFANSEFLSTFHFPLSAGDAQTALNAPNSLIITQELAHKIFGKTDPMGKIVELRGQGSFKITGVMDKMQGKTHIDFEILASLNSIERLEKEKKLEPILKDWENVWTNYIYLKIPENQSVAKIESEINRLAKANFKSSESKNTYEFKLQNLHRITPGPDMGNPTGKYMPEIIIYFLVGFVVLILLSACFNYANLSTARALTRAKEVGLRKVIGAHRWQLIAQFLLEATVFSLLAFVSACVLLEVLWIPGFTTLGVMRQELGLELKQDFSAYFQFLLLSLLIGVVSGLSPALYLSGFKPIQVLKGIPSLKMTTKRLPIRKALIIIQFTISLSFVLSSFVIYRQAQYLLSADMGFAKDNIVNVNLRDVSPQVFQTEIGSNSAVRQISFSSHALAGTMNQGFNAKNSKEGKEETMFWYSIDENFIPTFQLKVIAGQDFSIMANRTDKVMIVNEKALKVFRLGDAQSAIGKYLMSGDSTSLKIIGVVKDFNHQNLANEIRPLALRYQPKQFRVANIRLANPNRKAIMEFLEKKWYKLDNKHTLEAKFYDDMLANHPLNQIFDSMLKIVGAVAFLAVLIAGLGLLGMVIYLTEIRTKEIGLRKVLGAEIKQLIFLLARGFATMLLISIALALPLAWFLNNMWLSMFAHRVAIGIEFFLFGVFLIVNLGLLIIIPQTLKIARLNPTDVLRNE